MTIGLIMCGALAHEVVAIVAKHGWDAEIVGVPAIDHFYPERIAPDVEKRIVQLRAQYERLIVVFGDCGSRGELDKVLAKYDDIPRLQGPHCYDWYGGKGFHELMDEEPGTFFLTDYMIRGFKGYMMREMGLEKYPELRDEYFRHYKRVVYFVQKPDPLMIEKAKAAAAYIKLPLEIRATGYAGLEKQLIELVESG